MSQLWIDFVVLLFHWWFQGKFKYILSLPSFLLPDIFWYQRRLCTILFWTHISDHLPSVSHSFNRLTLAFSVPHLLFFFFNSSLLPATQFYPFSDSHKTASSGTRGFHQFQNCLNQLSCRVVQYIEQLSNMRNSLHFPTFCLARDGQKLQNCYTCTEHFRQSPIRICKKKWKHFSVRHAAESLCHFTVMKFRSPMLGRGFM